MSSSEIDRALAPLAALLDDLGVEYRIGGSVASSALGVPRSTLDVDIVAAVEPGHVPVLVHALQDEYYVDAELIEHGLRHGSSFNLIHLATMMKVDVFLPRSGAWEEEAFRRYDVRPLGGEGHGGPVRSYKLTTPEDVVLHKLRWFVRGGRTSTRQLDDVVGLLRVRAETLDHAYLDQWAEPLGVRDELTECRRRAPDG